MWATGLLARVAGRNYRLLKVGEGEAGEMIVEPIMVPMSTVLTKSKILALPTVSFLNGVSPHQP